MADAILVLHELRRSFGALKVTDGVSLDVREGEVHAVIGPNGAGKTTLISQIDGSLQPDTGTIFFRGADVTALDVAARARQGLARVFQTSNVIGSFSALENVALAAQAFDGSSFRFWKPAASETSLQDQARAALAEVGLQARAEIPAALLSHGEKRALELAMGLVQKPALLLLDEPMAGTGRDETERLTKLLASLKGRVPMLLIEHDMGTVFALADRISVLVSGRIATSGTPDQIRNDPVVREAYLGEEMP